MQLGQPQHCTQTVVVVMWWKIYSAFGGDNESLSSSKVAMDNVAKLNQIS